MLHPDIRGDGPCLHCGTNNNPIWTAPNTFWNAVTQYPDGILCIPCFIDLHRIAGYTAKGWVLICEAECVDCKRLFWQVDPQDDTCRHCILQHVHK